MIRIMKYGEEPNSAIFERSTATADVSGAVAEILPISARLITNKASYEFCRTEIEAIRTGILEQVEGKA